MANEHIGYIDINDILRGIKEKNKLLTIEEVEEIIKENIESGFRFEGQLINAVNKEFFNPLSNKMSKWFYFLCPKCEKRSTKLFILNGREIQCRICAKITSKSRANSQTERVMHIQRYLSEIFKNTDLSTKLKNKKINYVIGHYNALDNKYKLIYTNFVFKNLQSWCSEALEDKGKSAEYRKAIRDVMTVINDSKQIIKGFKDQGDV